MGLNRELGADPDAPVLYLRAVALDCLTTT
jgi:hypothetical protein